jgi:TRAP-type C4-dicarboxylate transport system substrate-binding protein
MNWNKWNALPKDLQAAFDAVADDAAKEAGAIWQHFQLTAMNLAKAKPQGHQFIRLPEAEWTRVKEMTKPIRDKWVADLNAKGLPGKEIMESAGTIMEKNNKVKYEPWEP